jgi:hypothetical protein
VSIPPVPDRQPSEGPSLEASRIGDDGNHMKYLCLVFTDERLLEQMPRERLDELVREHSALDDELKGAGQFVHANALQPAHQAVTVRVRQDRISVTDGPFAETKEQLTGFYLVDARDLNDAIQVAARVPSARIGCVEVRPIWDLAEPRQFRADA